MRRSRPHAHRLPVVCDCADERFPSSSPRREQRPHSDTNSVPSAKKLVKLERSLVHETIDLRRRPADVFVAKSARAMTVIQRFQLTEIVIFLGVTSVSIPPLIVPPLSRTWNRKLE